MEKIIIYVIIIVAGVLFDFVKKRARKSAVSKPANESAKPQAWNPFAQLSDLKISQNKPGRSTPDRHKTKNIKIKDKESEKIGQPKPSPALLTDEDEISIPPIADDAPIEISKQEIPAEVAAHYSRWRQAILDAEILQRKF